MVRMAVKFVFLMFSTSVLIFFIIFLWFVVESVRAVLVDFENRGNLILMNDEEVVPLADRVDLSDDFQLFVTSYTDEFLTEILTLNEFIQSG